VIHSQLQLLLNICPSPLPPDVYLHMYLIFLKRRYNLPFQRLSNANRKIFEKGNWSPFNLFERGVPIFFGESPFYVSGLDYGSLKFVETLVQLCIFIKDILIVDDYYKINRIYFDKQCILVPCTRHMVDISKKKPRII
jgi:hypothetical protein